MDSKQSFKTLDISVFDFCKTLVNIESADKFCIFALKEEKRFFFLVIGLLITSRPIRIFLNIFGIKIKFVLLNLLRGISKEKLEKIAKKYSKFIEENYLNLNVLHSLAEQQKALKKIFVISAGYSIYIKYFLKNFNVTLLSNDFEYDKNKFTGKITGKDCYGKEKLKRLKKELNNYKEFKISSSYSDSFSDMPIFDISIKKFLVLNGEIRSL